MCEHCFQLLAMHPGYQGLRYLLWVEHFDTMRDGGEGRMHGYSVQVSKWLTRDIPKLPGI